MSNLSNLAIRGPIPGLQDGDVIPVNLSVALGSRAAPPLTLALTARASPLVAALRGPRGNAPNR